MSTWHPLLSTRETSPGVHWMLGPGNKPYGRIEFVRRGEELGYRGERVTAAGEVTEVIGYFRTLRAAAEALNAHMLRTRGPGAR